MTIPKIIHQIWIGSKPPPRKLMKSWKEKHPDFEYILWTENEIVRRNMEFQCRKQIEIIDEIVGKVDIIRLEILYKYGGIYIDADSICMERLDDHFLEKTAFATYENENVRAQLVATGTMGFEPGHKLCKDMIDWISSDDSMNYINKYKAWYAVGPALLTKFLDTGNYPDFSVYPSHCFLPIHFTGVNYDGHKKVYAYQEWGNTKNSYDTIETIDIPDQLKTPKIWVSVLITSYNTNENYIDECLKSIILQKGHFGMEIIWIDDGSEHEKSIELEKKLIEFEKITRFCKFIYKKLHTNCGLSYCLHEGVKMCSHSLIFRMDSDDIMLPMRIAKQIEFMNNNPDCVVCGTNINLFFVSNGSKNIVNKTHHPEIVTYEMMKQSKSHWFMNHPTLCMRKEAILEVGNYNANQQPEWILEDFELGLKILKKYGKIHNMPDVLLMHRLHSNQLTQIYKTDSSENINLRNKMIDEYIT